MSGTSNVKRSLGKLREPRRLARDPRVVVRVILGLLLVANLVAALVLFRPWGSTTQELGRLREQVVTRQQAIERLRSVVAKVGQAREDGDRFMRQYFLEERTAYPTILAELDEAAREAGIERQAHSYQPEAIAGSSDLSLMTITGTYEGSYPNLVRFINLMDRSSRFLILDTLTAAPQRTAGQLSVNLRIHAFVIHSPESENTNREQGASEVAEVRSIE